MVDVDGTEADQCHHLSTVVPIDSANEIADVR